MDSGEISSEIIVLKLISEIHIGKNKKEKKNPRNVEPIEEIWKYLRPRYGWETPWRFETL